MLVMSAPQLLAIAAFFLILLTIILDGVDARKCSENSPECDQIEDVFVPPPRIPICRPSPNPWFGKCKGIRGYATLFLPHSNINVDKRSGSAQGGLAPSILSCPACISGTEFAYSPINPIHDVSDITAQSNLVVGAISCSSPSDLCAYASNGKKYRGQVDGLTILPVPWCISPDNCEMLLVVGGGAVGGPNPCVVNVKDSTDTECWADQTNADGTRKGYDEANYISISAITCDGCANELPSCDLCLEPRCRAHPAWVSGDPNVGQT